MVNQLTPYSSGIDIKTSPQPFHITTLAKSVKNKSKGKKLSYSGEKSHSKYKKNASFRVLSDEDLAYKTKKYLVYFNREYSRYADQDEYTPAKKAYKAKEYKKSYSKEKKPYKKEKKYYKKEEKSYKEEKKPYKQEPVEYKEDTGVYVKIGQTMTPPYMGIDNYKSEYKNSAYAEPETYGPVYMPYQENTYSNGPYNQENPYESDAYEPKAGISEYRSFGEAPERLLFDGSETYGMPNNVMKPYDVKRRRNEFAKPEVDPRSTYYLGLLAHQNRENKHEEQLMVPKSMEQPYTRHNSMPRNTQLYELQMESMEEKQPQPYDIRYSIFDPKATPPLGTEGKQYVSMLAHHKHKQDLLRDAEEDSENFVWVIIIVGLIYIYFRVFF